MASRISWCSLRGGALAVVVGLGCSLPGARSSPTDGPAIAVTDVTVLPMTGGAELAHANVVIRGEHVERVDTAPPPPGARVIDGHGKFLMPGLADMHVHLPAQVPDAQVERVALLSLLHGVTTLRGMQGAPDHLRYRASVTRDGLPSPELFLAGPPLSEALTPEQARARVREQKAAGYDLIKILGGLDRAAYDAVMDEARTVGIRVVGHVPAEIGIDAALAGGQVTIEHLMGYGDAAKSGPEALALLAARTRDAHVWNCPTLDYFDTSTEPDLAKLEAREGLAFASESDRASWAERKTPEPGASAVMDRLRREVLALQQAGAGLLVGSDSPGAFIVPGFGYIEELRELARAGLTPAQVLRAATRSAAESLGRDARDGTVQAGAIADLILVDRDPLESVENVGQPQVVLVRGRAWTRPELEARLGGLAP
jgi:imidazolonepropionase-like amidohydrolase